jgi:hypothetical protein
MNDPQHSMPNENKSIAGTGLIAEKLRGINATLFMRSGSFGHDSVGVSLSDAFKISVERYDTWLNRPFVAFEVASA